MKKTILTLCLVVTALVGLGSCDDGGPGWGPGPSNHFYDSSLRGDWKLGAINGAPVNNSSTNYMCFYTGGSGTYWYLENGIAHSERISWWCAGSGSNATVTVTYANGQVSTMYYWFSGGNLYLQWNTGSSTVTYRYLPVSTIPW